MKRLLIVFIACLLAFSLLGVSPWGSGGWGSGSWGRSEYIPQFTPNKIANCALWLDSNYGVTYDGSNRVTAWADKSGTVGNTTAAGAGSPLYATNIVNGRPALYFVTNDFMTIPQLAADISEATIFLVSKCDDATTRMRSVGYLHDGVYMQTEFNYSSADMAYWESYDTGYRNITKASAGVNSWHIWTLGLKENDRLYGWVDGTSFGTGTAIGTLSVSAAGRSIGRGYTTAYYFAGYIAEVVIYLRLLTDDERTKVRTYLSKKYGITL